MDPHVRRQLSSGVTNLMVACQRGRDSDVRMILNHKPFLASNRDRYGKTAVHYCAENSSLSCAYQVLSVERSLVNVQDNDGYSPLHLSVISGNKVMARFLLRMGADVNELDNEKHSCVHWATVCGDIESLEILIESGAKISTPDIHGAYPIHYAAQMCGRTNPNRKIGIAVLRLLLRHGAVVECQDKDGRQPLLWAACAGSSDAILSIISSGGSISEKDNDGLTALHYATSRGHTDCVEALITLCGANIDETDNSGCTALFYAVALGHADCTQLLLKYGAEADHRDLKGRTPVHCGASKGQLETLKLLENHGANMWIRDLKGDLPLHEAVQSGRNDLIFWLLDQKNGAVNAPNIHGKTPLHVVAINNNIELCQVLLNRGASLNALMKTTKGVLMTPMDAAISRRYRRCAKYLQSQGALPANKLLEKCEISRSLVNLLESCTQPSCSRITSPVANSEREESLPFPPDEAEQQREHLDSGVHVRLSQVDIWDLWESLTQSSQPVPNNSKQEDTTEDGNSNRQYVINNIYVYREDEKTRCAPDSKTSHQDTANTTKHNNQVEKLPKINVSETQSKQQTPIRKHMEDYKTSDIGQTFDYRKSQKEEFYKRNLRIEDSPKKENFSKTRRKQHKKSVNNKSKITRRNSENEDVSNSDEEGPKNKIKNSFSQNVSVNKQFYEGTNKNSKFSERERRIQHYIQHCSTANDEDEETSDTLCVDDITSENINGNENKQLTEKQHRHRKYKNKLQKQRSKTVSERESSPERNLQKIEWKSRTRADLTLNSEDDDKSSHHSLKLKRKTYQLSDNQINHLENVSNKENKSRRYSRRNKDEEDSASSDGTDIFPSITQNTHNDDKCRNKMYVNKNIKIKGDNRFIAERSMSADNSSIEITLPDIYAQEKAHQHQAGHLSSTLQQRKDNNCISSKLISPTEIKERFYTPESRMLVDHRDVLKTNDRPDSFSSLGSGSISIIFSESSDELKRLQTPQEYNLTNSPKPLQKSFSCEESLLTNLKDQRVVMEPKSKSSTFSRNSYLTKERQFSRCSDNSKECIEANSSKRSPSRKDYITKRWKEAAFNALKNRENVDTQLEINSFHSRPVIKSSSEVSMNKKSRRSFIIMKWKKAATAILSLNDRKNVNKDSETKKENLQRRSFIIMRWKKVALSALKNREILNNKERNVKEQMSNQHNLQLRNNSREKMKSVQGEESNNCSTPAKVSNVQQTACQENGNDDSSNNLKERWKKAALDSINRNNANACNETGSKETYLHSKIELVVQSSPEIPTKRLSNGQSVSKLGTKSSNEITDKQMDQNLLNLTLDSNNYIDNSKLNNEKSSMSTELCNNGSTGTVHKEISEDVNTSEQLITNNETEEKITQNIGNGNDLQCADARWKKAAIKALDLEKNINTTEQIEILGNKEIVPGKGLSATNSNKEMMSTAYSENSKEDINNFGTISMKYDNKVEKSNPSLMTTNNKRQISVTENKTIEENIKDNNINQNNEIEEDDDDSSVKTIEGDLQIFIKERTCSSGESLNMSKRDYSSYTQKREQINYINTLEKKFKEELDSTTTTLKEEIKSSGGVIKDDITSVSEKLTNEIRNTKLELSEEIKHSNMKLEEETKRSVDELKEIIHNIKTEKLSLSDNTSNGNKIFGKEKETPENKEPVKSIDMRWKKAAVAVLDLQNRNTNHKDADANHDDVKSTKEEPQQGKLKDNSDNNISTVDNENEMKHLETQNKSHSNLKSIEIMQNSERETNSPFINEINQINKIKEQKENDEYDNIIEKTTKNEIKSSCIQSQLPKDTDKKSPCGLTNETESSVNIIDGVIIKASDVIFDEKYNIEAEEIRQEDINNKNMTFQNQNNMINTSSDEIKLLKIENIIEEKKRVRKNVLQDGDINHYNNNEEITKTVTEHTLDKIKSSADTEGSQIGLEIPENVSNILQDNKILKDISYENTSNEDERVMKVNEMETVSKGLDSEKTGERGKVFKEVKPIETENVVSKNKEDTTSINKGNSANEKEKAKSNTEDSEETKKTEDKVLKNEVKQMDTFKNTDTKTGINIDDSNVENEIINSSDVKVNNESIISETVKNFPFNSRELNVDKENVNTPNKIHSLHEEKENNKVNEDTKSTRTFNEGKRTPSIVSNNVDNKIIINSMPEKETTLKNSNENEHLITQNKSSVYSVVQDYLKHIKKCDTDNSSPGLNETITDNMTNKTDADDIVQSIETESNQNQQSADSEQSNNSKSNQEQEKVASKERDMDEFNQKEDVGYVQSNTNESSQEQEKVDSEQNNGKEFKNEVVDHVQKTESNQRETEKVNLVQDSRSNSNGEQEVPVSSMLRTDSRSKSNREQEELVGSVLRTDSRSKSNGEQEEPVGSVLRTDSRNKSNGEQEEPVGSVLRTDRSKSNREQEELVGSVLRTDSRSKSNGEQEEPVGSVLRTDSRNKSNGEQEEPVGSVLRTDRSKSNREQEELVGSVLRTDSRSKSNGEQEELVGSVLRTDSRNKSNGEQEELVGSMLRTDSRSKSNGEQEELVGSVVRTDSRSKSNGEQEEPVGSVLRTDSRSKSNREQEELVGSMLRTDSRNKSNGEQEEPVGSVLRTDSRSKSNREQEELVGSMLRTDSRNKSNGEQEEPVRTDSRSKSNGEQEEPVDSVLRTDGRSKSNVEQEEPVGSVLRTDSRSKSNGEQEELVGSVLRRESNQKQEKIDNTQNRTGSTLEEENIDGAQDDIAESKQKKTKVDSAKSNRTEVNQNHEKGNEDMAKIESTADNSQNEEQLQENRSDKVVDSNENAVDKGVRNINVSYLHEQRMAIDNNATEDKTSKADIDNDKENNSNSVQSLSKDLSDINHEYIENNKLENIYSVDKEDSKSFEDSKEINKSEMKDDHKEEKERNDNEDKNMSDADIKLKNMNEKGDEEISQEYPDKLDGNVNMSPMEDDKCHTVNRLDDEVIYDNREENETDGKRQDATVSENKSYESKSKSSQDETIETQCSYNEIISNSDKDGDLFLSSENKHSDEKNGEGTDKLTVKPVTSETENKVDKMDKNKTDLYTVVQEYLTLVNSNPKIIEEEQENGNFLEDKNTFSSNEKENVANTEPQNKNVVKNEFYENIKGSPEDNNLLKTECPQILSENVREQTESNAIAEEEEKILSVNEKEAMGKALSKESDTEKIKGIATDETEIKKVYNCERNKYNFRDENKKEFENKKYDENEEKRGEYKHCDSYTEKEKNEEINQPSNNFGNKNGKEILDAENGNENEDKKIENECDDSHIKEKKIKENINQSNYELVNVNEEEISRNISYNNNSEVNIEGTCADLHMKKEIEIDDQDKENATNQLKTVKEELIKAGETESIKNTEIENILYKKDEVTKGKKEVVNKIGIDIKSSNIDESESKTPRKVKGKEFENEYVMQQKHTTNNFTEKNEKEILESECPVQQKKCKNMEETDETDKNNNEENDFDRNELRLLRSKTGKNKRKNVNNGRIDEKKTDIYTVMTEYLALVNAKNVTSDNELTDVDNTLKDESTSSVKENNTIESAIETQDKEPINKEKQEDDNLESMTEENANSKMTKEINENNEAEILINAKGSELLSFDEAKHKSKEIEHPKKVNKKSINSEDKDELLTDVIEQIKNEQNNNEASQTTAMNPVQNNKCNKMDEFIKEISLDKDASQLNQIDDNQDEESIKQGNIETNSGKNENINSSSQDIEQLKNVNKRKNEKYNKNSKISTNVDLETSNEQEGISDEIKGTKYICEYQTPTIFTESKLDKVNSNITNKHTKSKNVQQSLSRPNSKTYVSNDNGDKRLSAQFRQKIQNFVSTAELITHDKGKDNNTEKAKLKSISTQNEKNKNSVTENIKHPTPDGSTRLVSKLSDNHVTDTENVPKNNKVIKLKQGGALPWRNQSSEKYNAANISANQTGDEVGKAEFCNCVMPSNVSPTPEKDLEVQLSNKLEDGEDDVKSVTEVSRTESDEYTESIESPNKLSKQDVEDEIILKSIFEDCDVKYSDSTPKESVKDERSIHEEEKLISENDSKDKQISEREFPNIETHEKRRDVTVLSVVESPRRRSEDIKTLRETSENKRPSIKVSPPKKKSVKESVGFPTKNEDYYKAQRIDCQNTIEKVNDIQEKEEVDSYMTLEKQRDVEIKKRAKQRVRGRLSPRKIPPHFTTEDQRRNYVKKIEERTKLIKQRGSTIRAVESYPQNSKLERRSVAIQASPVHSKGGSKIFHTGSRNTSVECSTCKSSSQSTSQVFPKDRICICEEENKKCLRFLKRDLLSQKMTSRKLTSQRKASGSGLTTIPETSGDDLLKTCSRSRPLLPSLPTPVLHSRFRQDRKATSILDQIRSLTSPVSFLVTLESASTATHHRLSVKLTPTKAKSMNDLTERQTKPSSTSISSNIKKGTSLPDFTEKQVKSSTQKQGLPQLQTTKQTSMGRKSIRSPTKLRTSTLLRRRNAVSFAEEIPQKSSTSRKDGPVTFHVDHGHSRDTFKLPTDPLKEKKKWEITFTIKKDANVKKFSK